MNHEMLRADIYNYRRLKNMFHCMLNDRMNYNLNFDKNQFKYIGILFDSIKLICELDNITKLSESDIVLEIKEYKKDLKFEIEEKELVKENQIYEVHFKNGVKYFHISEYPQIWLSKGNRVKALNFGWRCYFLEGPEFNFSKS